MEDKWFDLYFRYIHDMVDLDKFSEWIYHSGCTEKILGSDGFFDYLDFSYMKEYEKCKIDAFLKETLKKYCIENYQKIEVKWLINQIFVGKVRLRDGVRILYELSKLGYAFISPILVEYIDKYNSDAYFANIIYSQRLYEEIKRLQNLLRCNECVEKKHDVGSFIKIEDADSEVLLIWIKNPLEADKIYHILNYHSIPSYIRCLRPYDIDDIYNGKTALGFKIYVPSSFYKKSKVLMEANFRQKNKNIKNKVKL